MPEKRCLFEQHQANDRPPGTNRRLHIALALLRLSSVLMYSVYADANFILQKPVAQ
jgi:hypothetical protein